MTASKHNRSTEKSMPSQLCFFQSFKPCKIMKSVKLFCYLFVLITLIGLNTPSVEAQINPTDCEKLETAARTFVAHENYNKRKREKYRIAAECYKNRAKNLKSPIKRFENLAKASDLCFLGEKYGLAIEAAKEAKKIREEEVRKGTLSHKEKDETRDWVYKLGEIIRKSKEAQKENTKQGTAEEYSSKKIKELIETAQKFRKAADGHRKTKNCKNAVEMYLKAATYWRKAIKATKEVGKYEPVKGWEFNANANEKLAKEINQRCGISEPN